MRHAMQVLREHRDARRRRPSLRRHSPRACLSAAVLSRLTALEPGQVDLMDRILNGPLIPAGDLETAGDPMALNPARPEPTATPAVGLRGLRVGSSLTSEGDTEQASFAFDSDVTRQSCLGRAY